MVTYGYARKYQYTGDGILQIQIRIPSIHGPYRQDDYKGQPIHNYTYDDDLPWYPSLLLPHMPVDGDVVAITSLDSGNTSFLVLGLTGGSYSMGWTNL